MNGDGYSYDALYIPTDKEVADGQFRFVSDSDRDRFMDYVHNDKYLSKHQAAMPRATAYILRGFTDLTSVTSTTSR